MTEIAQLNAQELRLEARRLFAKDDADRHWSAQAQLLGYIDTNKYYAMYSDAKGEPYASIRTWAADELGLPRSEFFVVRNLFTMMQRAEPAVSMSEWKAVSRAKALIIKKPLSLGGDPRTWFQKAVIAESTKMLGREVEEKGAVDEKWATWKVRVPIEMVEMLEAKMVAALPAALDQADPDPDRANDPDTRFRCLERIFDAYDPQREG